MMLVSSPRLTCRKLRSFEPALWRHWLELPPAQAALPDTVQDTASLLARLLDLDLLQEATRVLAYGLPEREAVWWSCMCVRHILPPSEAPVASEIAALQAAEAWVRRPGHPARQEAARLAMAAGLDSAAAWSALGAAWSHRVQQRPDLCGGRGAARAVERALAGACNERVPGRIRRFIEAGIDVGNGGAGRLQPEWTS